MKIVRYAYGNTWEYLMGSSRSETDRAAKLGYHLVSSSAPEWKLQPDGSNALVACLIFDDTPEVSEIPSGERSVIFSGGYDIFSLNAKIRELLRDPPGKLLSIGPPTLTNFPSGEKAIVVSMTFESYRK